MSNADVKGALQATIATLNSQISSLVADAPAPSPPPAPAPAPVPPPPAPVPPPPAPVPPPPAPAPAPAPSGSVSWPASVDTVDGYRLYWATQPGGAPYPNFVDLGQNVLSIDPSTIAGIGNGTRYFAVAGLNAGIPGAPGPELTVTV